ncbi:MAG: hypothetical protein ACN6O8_20400 [Achromobacter sp.]|uniref:hypothetical protein n=1 Tax=Achromobacter sp. TaxID=134375 RepID=UPI003D08B1E5
MKVIATALGYAGKDGHQLRQPGDIFEVADGETASWFKPVEDHSDDAKPASRSAGGRNRTQGASDDLA